jgi:hypothetical protein
VLVLSSDSEGSSVAALICHHIYLYTFNIYQQPEQRTQYSDNSMG